VDAHVFAATSSRPHSNDVFGAEEHHENDLLQNRKTSVQTRVTSNIDVFGGKKIIKITLYLQQMCHFIDIRRKNDETMLRNEFANCICKVRSVRNTLPPDLRSPQDGRRQFRSKLKTYLFQQDYNTA